MNKNTLMILLFAFLLLPNLVYSKCTGRYTAYSSSGKNYLVNITFSTGQELNNATDSKDYDVTKGYAVIFWGYGQSTIIKLDYTCFIHGPGGLNVYTCSMIESCKSILNGYLKGTDQNEDNWSICLYNNCAN